MPISGSFKILDWKESVEHTLEGAGKVANVIVRQQYSGDLEGSSEIDYRLFYTPNGDAEFNGFERITGMLNGQQCSMVLKHDGQFTAGKASSEFHIVDAQPLTEWVGRKGQFQSTEGGNANYRIYDD